MRPAIDHDPNEPPRDRSKSPWPFAAIGLVLLWAWYAYFMQADWISIGLGFGTGIVFASWAVDVTGNRVPASWRGKPPGPGR